MEQSLSPESRNVKVWKDESLPQALDMNGLAYSMACITYQIMRIYWYEFSEEISGFKSRKRMREFD